MMDPIETINQAVFDLETAGEAANISKEMDQAGLLAEWFYSYNKMLQDGHHPSFAAGAAKTEWLK